MKKITFSLLTLLFIQISEAAFKDSGFGTRPSGLAGAFTAISNDSNATLFNPAGIAQINKPEIQFMYSKPYLGLKLYSGEDETTTLSQNFLTGVIPSKFGSFGLSYADFSVLRLYSETTFALSYAKKIELPLQTFLGFNLKYLSQKYKPDQTTLKFESQSQTSPFVKDTKSNAFALDLGGLTKWKDFNFGLSLKNINQPDIGISQKDPIPLEVRTGISYNTNLKFFSTLLPTIEFYWRKPQNQKPDFRYILGVEGKIKPLTLRFGINDREVTSGLGFDLSLNKFELFFDYAFIWSLTITDNIGTHRISLGLKFGKTEKYEQILIFEEEKTSIQPPPSPPSTTPPPSILSPSSPSTKTIMKKHYYSGVEHLNAGKYEQALKEFIEVLKLEPNHKPSLLRIEKIKEELKKQNKEVPDIEKMLEKEKIDLNVAKPEELLNLGLSEEQVEQIIFYRKEKKIKSNDEIIELIGEEAFDLIKAKIVIR